MACPRCGGSVVTYALGDRSAPTCESCGYVGVPADHRAEPTESESWEAALDRFRRGEDRDGTVLEIGERTYRLPVEMARTVRDLTNTQRAVIGELLAEPAPTDPDRSRAEIAEAAGVRPSYVGDVLGEHEDLLGALASATILG